MDAKQMFESGAVLVRDYKGHEQMLMNEGTFIEIMEELVEMNKINNRKLNELGVKMKEATERINHLRATRR